MKDLKARLTSLARALHEMEQELGSRARDNRRELDTLDEQVLRDFKSAIDRVRHMVWPYVEAAADHGDLDGAIQRYRMERVTDMLENLRTRVETPDLDDAPEVQSFFSNIQQIATSAVEKHLERVGKDAPKRPVASVPEYTLPKRLVN